MKKKTVTPDDACEFLVKRSMKFTAYLNIIHLLS